MKIVAVITILSCLFVSCRKEINCTKDGKTVYESKNVNFEFSGCGYTMIMTDGGMIEKCVITDTTIEQ